MEHEEQIRQRHGRRVLGADAQLGGLEYYPTNDSLSDRVLGLQTRLSAKYRLAGLSVGRAAMALISGDIMSGRSWLL